MVELLREHKRKALKVLVVIAALYSIQWTREFMRGLLEYTPVADVQLISVIGAVLLYLAWLYHQQEI